MMREEKITASPGSSVTCGCSSRAMRASAERGSPWLPVQIISDLVAREVAGIVLLA